MIDVAFLGAHVRPAATAVVVDVLRATTTITTALASGYERVLVAGGIEEALELRADGRVLAGKRECERPPGFDLGNSPEETLTPKGRELVLATTNGAPAILGAVAACDEVLIACLRNEAAVVAALSAATGDILILCAGTNGNVTVEDTYLAGRISAALDGPRTDAALIAEAVAAAHPKPIDALQRSAGAKQLYVAGLGADVTFCAHVSTTAVVPRVAGTIGGAAALQPLRASEDAAPGDIAVGESSAAPGIANLAADERHS